MTAAPRPTGRRRRDSARTDDGGFALVWFALVLLVLMAAAGASVDLWNWWYNGNQQQRAADAAALAGAPFLPEDPAAARTSAFELAATNGYPASQVTVETSVQDATLQANEIRVTVGRNVQSKFLQVIGVNSSRIERDATAQYVSRLPMGSPEPRLGRDPEQNQDNGYWLSVSSRGDTKEGGDRYANYPCGQTYVYNCNSGNSTEFSDGGYTFTVQMTSAPTGDLVIEAYDPVHTETGSQSCEDTGRLPLGGANGYTALLPLIQLRYPLDLLAAARYAPGDTIYCQGDVGGSNATSNSTANVTSFIVREPDTTQSNDLDNPPISGASVNTTPFDTGVCTRQFRAINLSPYSGQRTIYQILAGQAGGTLTQNNDAANAAQAVYRRWVRLCTIPQATAQTWFNSGLRSVVVQVRSNADLGTPFTTSTASRNGRNHFALRAGYGTPTNGAGINMYALGRLPIHNGADGNSTTEFFLTRVPPGNAGRTLSLEFYDVADAGGTVDFEIVPPAGFGGSFTNCSFTRIQGNNNGTNNSGIGLGGATATGCRLTGMVNNQYNGRLTQVRIQVPSGYTCNLANANDCWIKVRVTYNAGNTDVFDHTVWDAGVVGEPVRLIE